MVDALFGGYCQKVVECLTRRSWNKYSRTLMTWRTALSAKNKGERHRDNLATLPTFMKSEIVHVRAYNYKLTCLYYQASFLIEMRASLVAEEAGRINRPFW